jgi:hypothetical protein
MNAQAVPARVFLSTVFELYAAIAQQFATGNPAGRVHHRRNVWATGVDMCQVYERPILYEFRTRPLAALRRCEPFPERLIRKSTPPTCLMVEMI